MDWIYLTQYRDALNGLVNTQWTVEFHEMREISWPPEALLACQEGRVPWS